MITYRRQGGSDLSIDDVILAQLLQQAFVKGAIGRSVFVESIHCGEDILKALPYLFAVRQEGWVMKMLK